MSRFYNEYRDAESMDSIIRRLGYQSFMRKKHDMMSYGASMLAAYRSKKALRRVA